MIVEIANRTAHVDGTPDLEGVEVLRKFSPERKALAGRVCRLMTNLISPMS